MTDTSPVPPTKRSWRPQAWSARTRLATVLVGVAVISILAIGVYNFVQSRQLLNDAARTQLFNIGASRANRIEAGLKEVGAVVTNVAVDDAASEALTELAAAFAALDDVLDPAELDELTASYEAGITAITPPGIDPPAATELLPTSDQARYLQYHYLVRNPFPADSRAELDMADDGSEYSSVHGRHHPTLRALSEAARVGDLILIDAATASIVYTVDKRTDFATNLREGPYRDSGLATAVLDKLNAAAADEAVLVDFAPYLPSGTSASLFLAAAVRDEGRVIGALAVEVPVAALTDLTTAGGDWQGTGLGETGEVYIVGPDRRMRSDSRMWLEDPAAYLEAAADAGYSSEITEAVEAFDTTVLIQPVETEAVEAALAGDNFTEGRTSNYLDRETVTVAGPLNIPGVQWVAVADVATNEAYRPLRDSFIRILITAAILIPLVAWIGVVLAGRLLRPVDPIAEAVGRVGAGELDLALPEEGRDEFSELGRRFNSLVEAMRQQRSELARTDAETTELLAAVVPSRFVDQVKGGDREVAEAVKNVTVVDIEIEPQDEITPAEEQEAEDARVQLLAQIAALADEHGLERIHSSASQQVFAAGLQSTDPDPSAAVELAVAAREATAAFGEEHGIGFAFRAGLAAGDVVGGVVGSERPSYEVWGAPPRLALALAGVAGLGEILVGESVHAAVGQHWRLEPVAGLTNLSGDPLPGWAVRERLTEPSHEQS